MKKVKLTRGKYALVDDEDFEYLNQFKWFIQSNGYAGRDIGGRKNKTRVLMHRLVNDTPDDLVTDHINRNKLDNRRQNLRSVTQKKNSRNRGVSVNNTSGHTGVIWNKGRWVACIKANYKKIHLGRYKTIEEAISARKEAEELYHV